jgi:hypothetical protein
MAIVFTNVLYLIYSAIFPYFLPEYAEMRPEPNPDSLWYSLCKRVNAFLGGYPEIARAIAHIRLNYYMPIFCPILWWRHIRAVNQLLDDIGR